MKVTAVWIACFVYGVLMFACGFVVSVYLMSTAA